MKKIIFPLCLVLVMAGRICAQVYDDGFVTNGLPVNTNDPKYASYSLGLREGMDRVANGQITSNEDVVQQYGINLLDYAKLDNVVATGNTPTYQWQVSTNSGLTYTNVAGATAATLTLTGITQAMNNNLYQVIVTVAPCATTVTSAAAKLTVTPLPVITIAAPITQLVPGRTTTITATSNPGPLTPASFSWTLNGVAVAGATSSTIGVDIDKIGVYRATVTDINGCVATSTALTIGTEASDKLWIYPNPTDGVFQVRLFQATDAYTRREVSVWNSNGQLITKKSFDFVRGMSPYYSMNFDLSKAAPGTYLVKVTEKNTMRIVSGLIVVQ